MNPLILCSLLLVCLPSAYLTWSVLSVDRKSQRAIREMLSLGRPKLRPKAKARTPKMTQTPKLAPLLRRNLIMGAGKVAQTQGLCRRSVRRSRRNENRLW